MIVCIGKKRLLLAAAGVLLALGLLFVLPGCQGDESETPPQAADNAQRVAYLESLGWQVTPEPLETLCLLLPQDLSDQAEYIALQQELSLPYEQYGGQTVTRYTYVVQNYPDLPQGVQLNLLQCGEQIIGGDVISLGENGFQQSLRFPA